MNQGTNCPICKGAYDLDLKIPYVLYCGHSICKECVQPNIKGCGICLEDYDSSNQRSIVVNHAHLTLLYEIFFNLPSVYSSLDPLNYIYINRSRVFEWRILVITLTQIRLMAKTLHF